MEYKFRAWDKKDKRMITHEQDFIPLKVTSIGVLRLFPTHDSPMYTLCDPERFELMQFTGLQDKNKKDIYEGDILKVENDTTGTVEFVDGHFRNSVSHWGLYTYLSMPIPYNIPQFEIIGNIHDKKES